MNNELQGLYMKQIRIKAQLEQANREGANDLAERLYQRLREVKQQIDEKVIEIYSVM